VIREWPVLTRAAAATAIVLGIGPICFLLRVEMLGIWALLLVIAAFAANSDSQQNLWRYVTFGAIAIVVLAAYQYISGVAAETNIAHRMSQYAPTTAAPGDSGIVVEVVKQGPVVRGIVQTLWIWFQPLPKLALHPGSVYTLGKVATPLWVVACLVIAASKPRSEPGEAAARERPSAMRWGPWRPLALWVLAVTSLIGSTSGEVRHLYCVEPVVCVLLAHHAHARHDRRSLATAKLHAAATAVVMLLACTVFTLAVFGHIGI
jgi:hypothetical protein